MLKLNPNESNHRLILQFKHYLWKSSTKCLFPLAVLAYFNGKLTNSLWVIRLVQNKVNQYRHHIAPKQPQYFEVIQKSINQIEIELHDNQGRILHFPNGSTIVLLHFRPRRLVY